MLLEFSSFINWIKNQDPALYRYLTEIRELKKF